MVDIALSPFLIQIILNLYLGRPRKRDRRVWATDDWDRFWRTYFRHTYRDDAYLGSDNFTNIAQVLATGSMASVVKKTWAFLFGAVIFIPLGLGVVLLMPEFFDRLLGILILVYSLVSLSGFNPVTHKKNNHLLGLTFGLLNSVLSGMTGSMTVPGVMYLRSLQLSSNDLLCALGILFLISTIAIGGSLWWLDLATQELSMLSVMMCVPVAIGVWVGMRVRSILRRSGLSKFFCTLLPFWVLTL